MMDLDVWKQGREEMMREAELNRMAKELRRSRGRRGTRRAFALVAWEMKRVSGKLAKLAGRVARRNIEEER